MKTDKIDALSEVLVVLDRDLKTLLGPPLLWESSATIPSVQQLAALRAEILGQREPLEYVHLVCTMGQQGTVPADWDEWSGGQPFDHHAVVVEALRSLPAGGQLSPALRTYLDELPSRLQRAHDGSVAYAQVDTTLPSTDIMKQFTADYLGRQSMRRLLQHLGVAAFAESYTADLARALELAQQRVDWASIFDCLT